MAQTVTLQDDEMVVKKSDFDTIDNMIDELEKSREERKILFRTTKAVLNIIGLIDSKTGSVYKDILEKKRSPLGPIMKGVSNTMIQLTVLSKIGSKKKSEAMMKEKFGFIEEFIPLMLKLDDNQAKETEQKQLTEATTPKELE